MAKVSIQNLHKSYGSLNVLSGINLDIADGEFISFLGPSGCGKSTLLRSIAGLEEINAGRVVMGDQVITDLPPAKRDIAMVFQNYALYPHMTVYKNLAFGMSLSGFEKSEIKRRVTEAADILQMTELLKRKPKQLSGGQRQRVAIGRAIVRDPKLFLLDEPLSNLDAGLRVTMRAELSKLHQRLGVTMIYVTHDQVEAMTLSNRIVVLDKGLVAQFGTPLELFYLPENRFVAEFIGSPKMNIFNATLITESSAEIKLLVNELNVNISVGLSDVKSDSIASKALTIGVRPENISLEINGEADGYGEVFLVERLGNECMVHMKLESGKNIVVLAKGTHPVSVGEKIGFAFCENQIHVFDDEGIAFPRQLQDEVQLLINRQLVNKGSNENGGK